MTIDWTSFTPWSALLGGGLIGLAAVLLLLFNGRIAGISGILGGLLSRQDQPRNWWRVAFVLGLVLAPLAWQGAARLPPMVIEASYPTLITAGFLVGISTRYGGGCTSGHGVCGTARLSPRSLVATLAFMVAGFATVFVFRHLPGVSV